MKKVIVVGCPGSGKSTFARKLQQKTGLPLYYLDMIWHKPDKTTVSDEEFDTRLQECVAGARARVGTKRIDMPWEETELSEEFLNYILTFPQQKLPRLLQLAEKYAAQKEVVIFHTRQQSDDYIAKL